MQLWQLRAMLVFFITLFSWAGFAQNEDQDLDIIEAEIKTAPIPVPKKEDSRSALKIQTEKKSEVKKAPEVEEVKIEKISDLSKLAPFSEVSTLQKRFMPKSGRFQANLGLTALVNDPWNSSVGSNLRFGYGFTEKWAIEGQAFFMGNSPSQSTQDLKSQHTIDAKSQFGIMSNFYGLNIMYTPIYGKMSLFNARIIPFDFYFLAGAGTSTLDGGATPTAPTLTVGTGQIFALDRKTAFRWDLTWNMFSVSSGTVNNLLLSFGASLFFPEAKYR